MYPCVSFKVLPEECQEFTLFLQPGLQPYLIAATAAAEAEEAEPIKKDSVIVIACIAIFQGVSRLLSWMRRRWQRQGAMELPVNMAPRQ